MPTVRIDPVLEAIAKKLFSIETVPFPENERMIKRAAKAARDAAKTEMIERIMKVKLRDDDGRPLNEDEVRIILEG